MEGIFINYRRDDSSGWANRLHRDLVDRFGADRVFRDLKLEPGVNFKKAIAERLRQCKVQLVLIGRQWLTVTDPKGRVRIQKADDLVRAEIAIALRSKIRIIPVLVHDADMPTAEDLPDDIRELAELNAVELSDRRWDHDTKELMDVMAQLLGVTQTKPDPEGHVRLSAPSAPGERPTGVLGLDAGTEALISFLAFCFVSWLFFYVGFKQGVLDFGGLQSPWYFAVFGALWASLLWWPILINRPERPSRVGLAASIITWSLAWGLVATYFEEFGPVLLLVQPVRFSGGEPQTYTWLAALGAGGASGTILALRQMFPKHPIASRQSFVVCVVWAVTLCAIFAVGSALTNVEHGLWRRSLFWVLGLMMAVSAIRMITMSWRRSIPDTSEPQSGMQAPPTAAAPDEGD